MTKRDQQRLYNAAERLVKAIRYGSPNNRKTCIYGGVDDEIHIHKRTTEIEKVLKSIKKP